MTLPNFLVIGAAKAGTSSLHNYLRQHPDIYLTPNKETYFFAYDGKAPSVAGPDLKKGYVFTTQLPDYEKHFAGVTSESAIGEVCPLYLYDRHTPGRIKHHVPNAKLVVVLRNPVDRGYSSYMHHVRDGYETAKSYEHALELEEERIAAGWGYMWHYRRAGLYSAQLALYRELFDAKQIRVYLHEDLEADPQSVVRDIFGFLGVDDRFDAETSMRHNATGKARSDFLRRIIFTDNIIKDLYRLVIPSAKLRNKIGAKVIELNLRKPDLSPALRNELTAFYGDDIKKLESLIGRDLSAWRQ